MNAAVVDIRSKRTIVKLRDAYKALRIAEVEEARSRELAARLRLELGRELAEIRKQWPRSGPNAKGWGDFLAEVGIDQQRAWEMMKLAGFVDGLSPQPGENSPVPTLLESGARAPGPHAVESEPPPGIDDEVEIDRDTWCTPKWITEAIGEFDLDPCSNERAHVKAIYSYRLERGEDGLRLATKKWIDGATVRVFVNPPYSDVTPWIETFGHARFCFLLKVDPSTKWFATLLERTEIVLVPRGTRVQFEAPPGVPEDKQHANPFPHALFYAHEADATKAIRELCFPPWRIR